MAVHKFQVVLHNDTGLPRDDFVNVLYYEVNAPDTIEGTCDEIANVYDIPTFWNAQLSGHMTIKVYPLAGGQPELVKEYTAKLDPGSGNGPSEVAICLSYAAVDDPQTSTGRRRGRIYVGPLHTANADRPGTSVRDLVLNMGQGLASVGTAGNTTWMLYSQTDASAHKIESIWVDDAWDIQRRRGKAPSTRVVQDVQ